MERLPRLLNVSLSDSWMFLKGCAAVLPILAISLYRPVEVMLPGILQGKDDKDSVCHAQRRGCAGKAPVHSKRAG
jgi:hypothetical protein